MRQTLLSFHSFIHCIPLQNILVPDCFYSFFDLRKEFKMHFPASDLKATNVHVMAECILVSVFHWDWLKMSAVFGLCFFFTFRAVRCCVLCFRTLGFEMQIREQWQHLLRALRELAEGRPTGQTAHARCSKENLLPWHCSISVVLFKMLFIFKYIF